MRISANAAGPEMAGRLTENGNRIGQFTIGGTLFLIVFGGAFAGLAGSALVAGSDPWLRWLGPLRGLGFGVLTLAASTTFVSTDFLVLDPPGLNVGMFAGLHIAFGLVVVGLSRVLGSRLPPAGDGRTEIGYLLALAAGGVSVVIELALFTVPGFCGCDHAYAMAVAVVVMLTASGVRYASSINENLSRWLSVGAAFAGYGSLVSLLALGVSRTFDQLEMIF